MPKYLAVRKMSGNNKVMIGLVAAAVVIIILCVAVSFWDKKDTDTKDTYSHTEKITTMQQETTTEQDGIAVDEENKDDGFSELIPLN